MARRRRPCARPPSRASDLRAARCRARPAPRRRPRRLGARRRRTPPIRGGGGAAPPCSTIAADEDLLRMPRTLLSAPANDRRRSRLDRRRRHRPAAARRERRKTSRSRSGPPAGKRFPTAAQGAVHRPCVRLHSRVALYDLREAFEAADQPLPGWPSSAVVSVGDGACLEALAAAFVRSAGGASAGAWRNARPPLRGRLWPATGRRAGTRSSSACVRGTGRPSSRCSGDGAGAMRVAVASGPRRQYALAKRARVIAGRPHLMHAPPGSASNGRLRIVACVSS